MNKIKKLTLKALMGLIKVISKAEVKIERDGAVIRIKETF